MTPVLVLGIGEHGVAVGDCIKIDFLIVPGIGGQYDRFCVFVFGRAG
jgi:hypothetical protein